MSGESKRVAVLCSRYIDWVTFTNKCKPVRFEGRRKIITEDGTAYMLIENKEQAQVREFDSYVVCSKVVDSKLVAFIKTRIRKPAVVNLNDAKAKLLKDKAKSFCKAMDEAVNALNKLGDNMEREALIEQLAACGKSFIAIGVWLRTLSDEDFRLLSTMK
jgi:hypothetical protein